MPRSPRHPRKTQGRVLLAGLGTLALGVAGIGAAPAFGTQPPSGPPPADQTPGEADASSEHQVTLITGDVVRVTETSGGITTVEVETVKPGAGWQRMQLGDDILVVPDAAAPYLAADSLDQDLFNVTKLIADGYDDASVDATPLIIERNPQARSVAKVPGIKTGADLSSVSATAASGDKADAAGTWQALVSTRTRTTARGELGGGIEKIHLDGKVQGTLATSVPWIGASSAWDAGLTGDGVTVAVLDSGYDDTHPDLAGRVSAKSKSFVPGEEVGTDLHGHGTHVASTVAGTGKASDGDNRGVADGAEMLVGKVLDTSGYGQDSWIIDAMEWASSQAPIVSMSLGTSTPSDGHDLMSQAVNTLTEQNDTLFIIAAGNATTPGSIGSPGAAAKALTVGSVDDPSGALSPFSSQGPIARTGALKPDIVGPGRNITAARSADSEGEGFYTTMSGTSMATPHIAGAAAILKQQHPEYTAEQLRSVLTSTTRDVGLTSYQAGSGLVDIKQMMSAPVIASGDGDFGMLPWGGTPKPTTREFTYTNRSDAEVTIALKAQLTDGTGDGESRDPSGLLTFSEHSLTIPAGEARTVTVTADAGAVEPGTRFTGVIAGQIDGKTVTRTAVGIGTESEQYDLTLTATGLDGKPGYAIAWVTSMDPEMVVMPVEVDGEARLRLPKGTYAVMSTMQVFPKPDAEGLALVGDPEIVLDSDQTASLDARAAKKVSVDVDTDDDVVDALRRITYSVDTIGGEVQLPVWVDGIYAQPMETEKSDFEFATRWRVQLADVTVKVDGKKLDVIQQAGSTPFDGKLKAKLANVGTGTADEIAAASLKGKVAVATLSADVNPGAIAEGVSKAGARMLILVSSTDQEFSTWIGNADGSDVAPISVVGISGIEGRDVIKAASRNKKVTAVGDPVTDELWDVVRYSKGEIPEDLTDYEPELARIDTRFFGPKGQEVAEARVDLLPGWDVGTASLFRTERGTERTEWVSGGDTRWFQIALGVQMGWDMRDVPRVYEGDEKLETSYFSPIVRPYVGNGYWAPYRTHDYITVNVPGHADAGNTEHTGALWDGTTTTGAVYVNGEKVQDVDFQTTDFDVPAEKSKVRFEYNVEHDGAWMDTSTRTSTAWEFTTARSDQNGEILPMLQAYYSTPLSDAGKAGDRRKKGAPVPMHIELNHLGGALGAAAVKGATLEMRLPGGNWKAIPLKVESISQDGTGTPPDAEGFVTSRTYVASFSAKLPVPDKGGYIDLRLTGTDEAGNSITQEIEKAVEVAPARGAK